MGATNAIAAYRRYAGKLPGQSMAVLVYMALVSKDKDLWPWFTLGQHAIAEHALGRPNPNAADLRAVQRAISPLIDADAVTVDRAGAARSDGNTTARYRLNLHEEADEARRQWSGTPDGKRRMSDTRKGSRKRPAKAETPDENRRVDNPSQDHTHPTVSDGDTRRFLTRHPTVSDETPDENRRAKETRGDKRSEKTKEESVDLSAAVTVARDDASPIRQAPVVELRPGISRVARYIPPPQWSSPSMDNVAEASARRQARVAEHQAQLAAAKEAQ